MLLAGKPAVKGKAAAKPGLKKQTKSRKRKLDDIHLQAAAQLQVHNIPAPRAIVMPLPLAAATPVPFTSSQTVHAGVTSNPKAVQAAPPVASASSQPAPAAVTQQMWPEPEVADTSAAAAQGAEEEASAAAAAAGRSDTRTPAQGAEEAASTAANGSRLDSRAAAPQPGHVAQPDSVMSQELPTTAAAVFGKAEDQPQLSPQVALRRQAPFADSFNSTAAASDPASLEPQGDPHPEPQPESGMSKPDLQPDAVEADGTGLAACEAPSAVHLQALQQRSAEGAAEGMSFTQQAAPNMSAPLSDADVEMAWSLLEPASARGCLNERLLHDVDRLQASADDDGALKAQLSEAQHELEMSDQSPSASESAVVGVSMLAPAEVPPASLQQQPKKPSSNTAPVSIVAKTHEAAKKDDSDAALTGQQAEETRGTEAFETNLPLCCTSSSVQHQDKRTLSEHNQVQCSSAPGIASATLKGDGEGTVVMLDGNSLLGLASYSGSDSDSR